MKLILKIIIIFLLLFNPIFLISTNNKSLVTIDIKVVGDIMMGTTYPYPKLPPRDGRGFFDNIKSYLMGSDILIGNLEGTFTKIKHSVKKADNIHSFAFRMPLYYINYLKEVGFTVLNVANNHSRDFGILGLKETIAHLTNNGIKYTGLKNQIAVVERKGVKIGIVGFYWRSFFNSIIDLKKAKELLKKAKNRVDILIVTFHGGSEGIRALHTKNRMEYFKRAKRGNVVRFAHTAINSGADFVFGHGPHLPRAMELYKGKIIAYSLGNFATYGSFNLSGPRRISLILEIVLDSNGNFVRGKIIPVVLKNNGIPYYDPQKNCIKLIQRLTKEDFPKTKLFIRNDGEILIQD